MERVVYEWNMTSIRIHQWFRFLFFWEFVGYRPNDPSPVRRYGITYTYWGANRAIRKAMEP